MRMKQGSLERGNLTLNLYGTYAGQVSVVRSARPKGPGKDREWADN